VPVQPTLVPRADIVFDGQVAMQHVEAQMDLGPRPPGSEAARQTGDYILAQLEAQGWEALSQEFDYNGLILRNLIGRFDGPSDDYVIVGAHYDTRFVADEDPNFPDQPVPGANDGASGVAVLLELARVADLTTMNADVWLVFFDAEDNGRIEGWDWIVGSSYFAQNMALSPEWVVIADMIGDADQNIYYESSSDPELNDALWAIADELGYRDYFIPEIKYSILDDHTPFLMRGIPAVDIIDFDYPYWHTIEDTIDKVSPDSLERVGRVIEVFLERGGTY
ncbi:MAG: M28 family peptidase, partial [Chloroflexi bacterium]|nr:M28 family peptidase [Chloroflexota bacterium]